METAKKRLSLLTVTSDNSILTVLWFISLLCQLSLWYDAPFSPVSSSLLAFLTFIIFTPFGRIVMTGILKARKVSTTRTIRWIKKIYIPAVILNFLLYIFSTNSEVIKIVFLTLMGLIALLLLLKKPKTENE